MAGFEKVRTLEGMWAPIEVRCELRQMFDRWLSRSQNSYSPIRPSEMVDELSLLNLCQHYRLEYPGGMEDIASTWDESEERIADGGPTFDDLKRLGWVIFDGGRWVMPSAPLGTLSHITYPSPSTQAFLMELSNVRLIAKTEKTPLNIQILANKILAENWLEQRIPTKDTVWLLCRLWERLCPKPLPPTTNNSDNLIQAPASIENEVNDSPTLPGSDAEAVDRAFFEWSAWCNVLGGFGRWDISWNSTEAQLCREAAYRVLKRQNLWGAWNNDLASYTNVLEKTFAIPRDQLRFGWTPSKAPSATLLAKADWLTRPDIEHLIMERLLMGRYGQSTVSFAFGLLCSELEKIDIGPDITSKAATFLLFAINHPMALQQLRFRVNVEPALLVDMLMHPRATCLATKWTIKWQAVSGRNRDRNMGREAQIKTFAIQDSLSFIAHHLKEGTLDLEECASLITWCYIDSAGSGRAVADPRRLVGRQLIEMIAKENEKIQSTVLQHLIEQAAYENNVPRACFAGVLDGLNCLPSISGTDVLPIIALYSKFACNLNLDWTDVVNLSPTLTVRLVATAFAQAAPDRDALLVPFDSTKLIREASNDDRPSVRSSIARTLRIHVRLLARAVSGWPDEAVPSSLCDALIFLTSRSVIEHDEKGRVGALTDKYSPSHFLTREEGSPARDLAVAWRKLDSSNQKTLLQVFTQSDDPVLLAELCQHLPAAAKLDIQVRLRQLKPGEASTLWTWPELQHRIESLLAAGEYELAREHLDDITKDLDRAPPQFRLDLFGLELQLLMKEKNWITLDDTIVPLKLDPFIAKQAQDQLDFYRATSQLLRPDGDLINARVILQRLAAQPGAGSAYKENFFAVTIQQLLGPKLLPLDGANKVLGESLLEEINAVIAIDEKLVRNNLLANRALLMLALQRPEDALESLNKHRKEIPSPDLELIVVLAKYEMGLRDEALAILDAAIVEFGADSQLIALKNDLQTGVTTLNVASAPVAIDSASSIRAALQQLGELLPSQIGDILGPPGRGVRGYLVRQVSRAVASLQHMAGMLRDRKNPEDEAKFEDDLNTAVREVLGASLAVAKWDVADQSLGGVTANENPGERDAVIRVSGQEISIYEALVCSGLDRTNIKKHFDKLLSYGTCDVYFHVIYSYAQELKPLLDYVKQMLEHEIPPSLSYLSCEFLTPPDYETSGYIATYRVDHREIAVVFLVVDLKTRTF